jgi:hypothetical protein
MIRTSRFALIAAALVAAGCASDGTTSPTIEVRPIEARLAATADVQSASITDPSVTVRIAVVSSLTEIVTGGQCAQIIEARLPAAATWTDVTSKSAVCSTIALVVSPGATANITGTADQAAVRLVANGSKTVVLRARHSLVGSTQTYTLQTNEVTWTMQ